MCRLSKRQLHFFEEFMVRSATKASLSGGNFLGMMNVLIQLRKVCNHPDLFEPRPIQSPFACAALPLQAAALVTRALERHPLETLTSKVLRFWDFNTDTSVRVLMQELVPTQAQFIDIDDIALSTPAAASASLFSSNSGVAAASLCGAKFEAVIEQHYALLHDQKLHKMASNYSLLRTRGCRPRLPLHWRSVRICKQLAAGPLYTTRVVHAKQDARANRSITPAWLGLVHSVTERAEQMHDTFRQFVFVLPTVVSAGPQLITAADAGAGAGGVCAGGFAGTCAGALSESVMQKSLGPAWTSARRELSQCLLPFYPSLIRETIIFPDRKLVQFNSGKLRALAKLLRDLKKGSHKCLIFTQMSKMLDILDIFLNLNDHTFFRLDGSTSIERRQKLMDKFNSDPKLFCFILSTRSCGLGINLTGADSVIFYDTDWNPAMDAQAQDRAHRIGQTRDVHIYRLVCESTVEKYILTKARQKKHLDFLVMTEGNFSEASLFSSSGLKDMLGTQPGSSTEASTGSSSDRVQEVAALPSPAAPTSPSASSVLSASRLSHNPGSGSLNGAGSCSGGTTYEAAMIEAAMLAAEDAEDAEAMHAARFEAQHEMDEFDDSRPATSSSSFSSSSSSGTASAGGGAGVEEMLITPQLWLARRPQALMQSPQHFLCLS